jgi:polyisoprenoid-binding protein YceI
MKNLLTSVFLIVSAAQAAPATLALARSHGGAVTIVAHGPAGLRIEGKSAEVSLDDETSALVFKVPVATIDTGIGLRNRHLREALEADKFPVATMRVPRAGLTEPSEARPLYDGSTKAELTLHGRTRPVSVHYRAERDAGLTKVLGSLQFDVRDFDIQLPTYLGVTVHPEVEVEVVLSVELP